MTRALSCEAIRTREREVLARAAMPSLLLMENAGRAAVDLLVRLGIAGRVVIACGKGNNGGDGFVIARHLDNQHFDVQVQLFARPEELAGDAAVNFSILQRSGVPLTVFTGPTLDEAALRQDFATADWIVDALFGTGLRGPLRAPFDSIVTHINESSARVLAVDIPSGLDADAGVPLGPTVRANHTATFIALKQGFTQPSAQEWLGRVHLLDVGLPRRLLAE
jgi:NAD(P)H-hydrate epimerase